jgi:uncharacterized protein with ParB-like and HNH nuclease domain
MTSHFRSHEQRSAIKMKPSIQTLGQILYSPSQYAIPVFQRHYRWERPQWAKLWDSLLEIQSPEKKGNHFMGFLVFIPGLPQPGQNTVFHLIDGQQRLTTSSILLIAIRNAARLAAPELAAEIEQLYLFHPLKKGDAYYRLLPKDRDHDTYVALLAGTTTQSGRMTDALKYFEDLVTTFANDSAHKLRQLFNTVCQRLDFMCATLEVEDAYNIFKSLNSTGVPLEPSDLIRNFVFMHVPPDEQDEFDLTLWRPLEVRFARADGTLDEEAFSKFFRDFLMSTGRYVAPKDIFSEFESRYEATKFSPAELARQLSINSRYYAIISGVQTDQSPQVTQALAGLNVFDSPTTYPLLLALFRSRAAGVIDSERLTGAIEMVRGFILRRFICGESSRGYGQMFVRALASDKNDPASALQRYLLERGWPDDRRFQAAFANFPLYQRGYTREILETLEWDRGHREQADMTAATVEHIMPQTLSEEWACALGADAQRIHAEFLHRPGNLTLSAYNLELWNHPFDVKRDRYRQSNIGLTRELAGSSRWSVTQIEERGARLAENAARIWIGPKEPFVSTEGEVDSDDDGPGRQQIRRLFWNGLGDFLAENHPGRFDFEVRPSSVIRMASGVRHIGVELRFSLRHSEVGLDVWFWREASFLVWERIRSSPGSYNSRIGATWSFVQVDGRQRGRMSLDHAVTNLRDESTWPDAYRWLGESLSAVYAQLLPALHEELDLIGADARTPASQKQRIHPAKIATPTALDDAIAQLHQTLNSERNSESWKEIVEPREQVLARFQPLFARTYIPNLTDEEIRPFFYFESNRHWTGLYRQVNRVCTDIPLLRETLLVLTDENRAIEDRLDEIDGKIFGLGKGIITAILLVVAPEKYGVWNATSEAGLVRLGLFPRFERGTTFGAQYDRINEVLHSLARSLGVDLWTLDALWWWLESADR